MKNTVILTTLLLSIPLSAHAACQSEQQTVFSCMTAKGKVIQLCDQQQYLSLLQKGLTLPSHFG